MDKERLEELKAFRREYGLLTNEGATELIAEVEFLTKVVEQAVAGSDLRVGCCVWEGQARDFYQVTYPESETVYSGHRSDTYPTHAPELAQYLKRGKE